MYMKSLRLVDNSLLNKTKTVGSPNYHLSFLFTYPNIFSFCVINKDDNKFLSFCKYDFSNYNDEIKSNLLGVFESDELLKNSFNSVSLNFTSRFNTLIPIMFFSRKKKENYANIFLKHSDDVKGEKINYDFINPLDVVNLYSYFPQLTDTIKNIYSSKISIRHNITFFIINCFKYHQDSREKAIYINVNKKYFDALVINNEKLFLCNTFSYKTAKDFLYYILLVFKNVKLSTKTHKVILFGNIDNNSPLFKMLYDYIKNIKFNKQLKNIKVSNKLSKLSKNELFYFLNID